MAARGRSLWHFGQRLLRLRKDRNLTAPQVTRILRERWKLQLDDSTLYNYEGGTVGAPDAGVLWGLAQIYEQDFEELVALLVANRGNPNLKLPPVGAASTGVFLTDEERRVLDIFRDLRAPERREAATFLEFLAKKGKRGALADRN